MHVCEWSGSDGGVRVLPSLSLIGLGPRWGRSRPVRRARMVDAGKDSSLQLYTFDHYPTLDIQY